MADDAKRSFLNRLQQVEDVVAKSNTATLTTQETRVRGDTTSTAFTLTLKSPEQCAGLTYIIQANKPGGNDLTVAFTGVAPDGSQVIAVDEGYVVVHSFGHMWVVLAKKLA